MQSLTAPAGTPTPPAAMSAWVCPAYGGTEALALKLGADQALDYRQHSPARAGTGHQRGCVVVQVMQVEEGHTARHGSPTCADPVLPL